MSFADPDGLRLELVATREASAMFGASTSRGPIPKEQAIGSIHGVTLAEEGYENTARLLTDVLGFRLQGNESNRFRYRAAGDEAAAIVDLLCAPDAPRGTLGTGVVHHVAFRTPDDTQQAAWRSELVRLGHNVSPVMDRMYFHSIYFREPGGVLFEIATAAPGFAVDESAERLGTALMLPSSVEPFREQLEKLLPPLRLPKWHA